MRSTSRRPRRPDRRGRTEPGTVTLRNGLDYLDCYAALCRRVAAAKEPPGASGEGPSDDGAEGPVDGIPLEGLLALISAYEATHAGEPVVVFARDPRFDGLDLALLRALFVDRVMCGNEMAGILPLALLKRAGVRGLGASLHEVRRLLPGSPLLATGFVEMRGKPTQRMLSRPLAASERLVSLLLGDESLLPAVLGNGSADPDFGAPWLFDDAEGDVPAPALEASTQGDLVLPSAAREDFERVVRTIQNRDRALAAGLGDLLPSGKGVAVLLSGPPGCGKTQAARVLARRLGRPLHLLSCVDVLDKYVGETERRIRAAFRRAAEARAVLCFDEADALLAARDQMEHHFQRQMVSEFLVGLERFEGVICFATNAIEVLDPAFERRFTARIVVPRPGYPERREIWQRLLPPGIPRAPDVDVEALAAEDLSGGEIRNAILAAVTEVVARDPLLLTQADLREGLRAATAGRWTRGEEAALGFRTGDPD